MTSHVLDTHAFMWWIESDGRLSNTARESIATTNRVVVTDVSLWEIAIKASVGKFVVRTDVLAWFERNVGLERFGSLPITRQHLARTAELPMHHRDPFDRLLVAQAQVEQLSIVTNDPAIARYDVETVW